MSKRSSLFILLLTAVLVPACILNTGYHGKDGTYVYADSAEFSYEEHPIPSAHPQTFQILRKHGYAKDDLHVYYHYTIVLGADPRSFEAMTDLYGRDKDHVYYEFRKIPGADPATFKLFDIQWGRDSHDIYKQDRPIEACDPDTFALQEDGWHHDAQCVYHETGKLPNADPASFVVLNSWFAKDKNNVYSSISGVIAGADPATFKIREGKCVVCAEDKSGCYKYDERVNCESLK